MEKTYEPHAIEKRWYDTWEERGYFAPSGNGDPYCIMIPPPNVTGTLHMGHAFQDAIMDSLIRYHRMLGDNTLWQPGTDHAGIATQMVVERQLDAEGKTRHDLGREAFVERVWQWREESGGTITRQLRRMGTSVDWERERFTMEPDLSEAVTQVFVSLYDEELIYRGQRLVNWDPVLHTALSDLEVISEEEQGNLWHLRYPLVDSADYLVVATTRPETMLGDTAVAVHPQDERYQAYIGKRVALPLCGREIPVIADEYVDPEFGSGCLKITPAHDFNDYEVGQRHELPMINVFTDDASLNDNAPPAYRGLDRFEARDKVVTDLTALELLERVEKHKLMVPRGDRSHAVVEPYLTNQWFVRAGPLAEESIRAVRDGRIRFVPENWSKTYFNWMENIQDWCISRQIWWGHRIPAWFDDAGNIYVAHDEAAARTKYQLADDLALQQEDDVLDTWFSSALWPFSTLGWPKETPALNTFYPTSVLVTGFDIIFFWVARMIMFGLKFMGEVPFHEVYIHGLVRDADGQKMSKSKGNVLDPIDLIDGITLDDLVAKRTSGLMQPHMAERIEKTTRRQFPDGIPSFGTDALRFTFAALASTGRDIRFDLKRIEGYRNFCNKLWNASRYVLMSTEGHTTQPPQQRSTADRWIVSELQRLELTVNENIRIYRFDLAAQAIYDFTWNEYCDWYVELSKPVLSGNDNEQAANGTRYTLLSVLETLLRLLHPFMPFITEELWQRVAPALGKDGDTIMQQPYPQAQLEKTDTAAVAEIAWLKGFVMGVRRIRAEYDISPGKRLSVLFSNGNDEDKRLLDEHDAWLTSLARLDTISWLTDESQAPEAAMALVGDAKVLIPLSGLIEKQAELQRIDKEIAQHARNLERSQVKLDNPDFVAKAPSQVIDKERGKLSEAQNAIEQLRAQRGKIAELQN